MKELIDAHATAAGGERAHMIHPGATHLPPRKNKYALRAAEAEKRNSDLRRRVRSEYALLTTTLISEARLFCENYSLPYLGSLGEVCRAGGLGEDLRTQDCVSHVSWALGAALALRAVGRFTVVCARAGRPLRRSVFGPSAAALAAMAQGPPEEASWGRWCGSACETGFHQEKPSPVGPVASARPDPPVAPSRLLQRCAQCADCVLCDLWCVSAPR